MIPIQLIKNAPSLVALLWLLLTMPSCVTPPDSALADKPVLTSRPVALDNFLVIVTGLDGTLAAERRMLADAVVSELRQTGMFASVAETPADLGGGDGVKLQLAITALKPVTENSRIWTGPLAGRARVEVRVKVTDLKSGRPIETFAVTGQSGQSANAGTTDEAIHMAVRPIAVEMLRLNARLDP